MYAGGCIGYVQMLCHFIYKGFEHLKILVIAGQVLG
jgi:hypothetical protein